MSAEPRTADTGSDIRPPRTSTDSWTAVHESALAALEPVFVPVTPYADERGWSLMNLLAGALGPDGQINYSVQRPGVVKAWHRHRRQTDFWVCVRGHLKVGILRESDHVAWTLVTGETRPGVLIIPPPLWHGAMTIGPEPAGLLYYVTHRYDAAAPDEERRPVDSVPGFTWSAPTGGKSHPEGVPRPAESAGGGRSRA